VVRIAIEVMAFLDGEFVDGPCSGCGYPLWVELIDVRIERRIFCPCCKAAVQLVDAGASNDAAMREVDAALRRLGFAP
jgi:hypothetical protein